MPTRAEIRLAAAMRRNRAADAALAKAYENNRAAIEAATKKHQPRIWAASRAVRDARAAVSIAELAVHDIKPMKTIFEHNGKFYTAQISREGWALMLPVGLKRKVLQGRSARPLPYKMRGVFVTDMEIDDANTA